VINFDVCFYDKSPQAQLPHAAATYNQNVDCDDCYE